MCARVRQHVFAASVIVLLGIVVYANILGGEFVWDDDYLVRDNLLIKHSSSWGEIFLRDISAGSTSQPSAYYRPLQILTYAFDHLLSRSNPFVYHLDSVFLHILVALGVYWLGLTLSSDRMIAILSACLFVVHPVHTEAVAYISGRADPLSALFMVLSVCCYVGFLRTRDLRLYACMMLGFIFALLSREASIILPLLLLSYHWSFKKRFLPREIFPVLGLSALYILWRFFANKHLFIHWISHLSLMQRIAQGFASLIEYMRLLLVPFPLHMEYGTRAFPYWHPKVLFGAIFLCVGLWYVFKKKRDGLLCFCILWFFASLLPVSNLIPLGTYMAEHWLYLPSIGFFILSARTLSMLFGRVAIGLVCLALSVSMILTIRQNKTWMKRIHLYEHTLKYAPESLAALNNLGLEYSAASRYDEAITLFNKALAIDHRYADTYNNLGKVYFAKGDIDQAIGYYKKALEIDPLLAQGYNNIGIAYSHKKEYDEALKYLTQAITRNPNFVLGYFNLAVTFADLNRFEEASQLYQRTIQLDPDFTYAYSNLGFLYAQLGAPAKAVPLYKKALALNPRLAQVYNNLGAAYLALNRVDKAKEAFRKTIETDPQYAAAYNNLAVIYFYAKDLSLAKEYCDKALLLGYPVNPEFLKSLKNSREN